VVAERSERPAGDEDGWRRWEGRAWVIVPVRQVTAKAPIIILRALEVLLLVEGEEAERRERRKAETKGGMARRLLELLFSDCPGAAAAADANRGEEEGRVRGRRAGGSILVSVIQMVLPMRVLLGRRGSWKALTVVAAASKAMERRRRRGGRGGREESGRVAMTTPVGWDK